ncbi:MAG TPA: ParA family protein [Microvirga sp.]|nr:ParA family protein [Microvirga sp.]
MNVLVFASRKGGSGKSTLAAHLAAHVAKPTRPTLLIDADPQGSLSLWHELRGEGGLSLKRSARSLAHTLGAAQREGYAWAFIDTPPNKSPSVVEAVRLATLVVIPTRPSVFDLSAVRETIELARELKKPYAVVLNAAPAKRNDAEAAMVAEARAGLAEDQVPVWSGQITHRTDFSLALRAGEGVREFASDSPSAAEIAQLWTAIDRSVKAIHGAYKTARGMHRIAA